MSSSVCDGIRVCDTSKNKPTPGMKGGEMVEEGDVEVKVLMEVKRWWWTTARTTMALLKTKL